MVVAETLVYLLPGDDALCVDIFTATLIVEHLYGFALLVSF